jgi:hypothetical protein
MLRKIQWLNEMFRVGVLGMKGGQTWQSPKVAFEKRPSQVGIMEAAKEAAREAAAEAEAEVWRKEGNGEHDGMTMQQTKDDSFGTALEEARFEAFQETEGSSSKEEFESSFGNFNGFNDEDPHFQGRGEDVKERGEGVRKRNV